MKKLSLLLLASIISLSGFSRPEVNHESNDGFPFRVFFLSRKIKSHAVVEDRLIGRGAKKSKQYLRAQKLGKLASDKKLIKYCESKSPTLRAYAYALLCERKEAPLLEILSNHQTDKACVRTFGGCIKGAMSVYQYMLFQFEDLLETGTYELTAEEQLIFSKLEDQLYQTDCIE